MHVGKRELKGVLRMFHLRRNAPNHVRNQKKNARIREEVRGKYCMRGEKDLG